MVTLRRDVAAMQNNDVFDRIGRDQELMTDYDRFMQEKKRADNISILYTNEYLVSVPSMRANEKVRTNTREKNKQKVQESISQTFKTYDDYMLSQINRMNPDKILSLEEFNEKYHSGKNVYSAVKKEKEHISKRAKIFISLYLLSLIGVAALFFFTLIG